MAPSSPRSGGRVRIPQALASDAAGHLYVADRFSNRVKKFGDPPPAVATPPATSPPPGTPKKKCKKKQKRAASAKKKKCGKKKMR